MHPEPCTELPGSRKCLDLSALYSVELLALLDFIAPSSPLHTAPSLSGSPLRFTLGSVPNTQPTKPCTWLSPFPLPLSQPQDTDRTWASSPR